MMNEERQHEDVRDDAPQVNDITATISALHLKDGDLVVLRTDADAHPDAIQAMAQTVRHALDAAGRERCPIMIFTGDVQWESIPVANDMEIFALVKATRAQSSIAEAVVHLRSKSIVIMRPNA